MAEEQAVPAAVGSSGSSEVNYSVLGIDPDSPGEPTADESALAGSTEKSPDGTGAPPGQPPAKTASAATPPIDKVPGQTPGAPVASPPPEKFSFYGRDFPNREAAEQYFRSWEGRLSESDRRANEYYAYVTEVKRQNDELVARHNERVQAQEREKATSEKKTFVDDLNLEELAQVVEMAKSQGVDPTLILAQHMGKIIDARMESREAALRAELSEPVNAMQNEQLMTRATGNLFLAARDHRDEQGNLLYPGLGGEGPDSVDEALVRAVYQSFDRLARTSPELAFGPTGFDYAYLTALRSMPAAPAGGNGRAAPPAETASAAPGDGAPSLARDAKGRFVSAQEAASEAAASVDTSARMPESEEIQDDGSGRALMKEIMRRAPREVVYGNTGLGFTP